MKRFFAFGCSYTAYNWPSWADYIALSPQFAEAYNFALAGAGNQFIAARLFNAHQKYRFTSDDVVAVCWSTVNREDRIKDGMWVGGGNVFNHFFFDDAFLDKYWDFNDALMKTTTAISMVSEFLKANRTQYYFTSMLGTSTMFDEYKNNEYTGYDQNLLEYTNQVVQAASFRTGIDEEFVNGGNVFNIKRPLVKIPSIGKQQYDHHPSPKNHYEWVSKVLPSYLSQDANALMVHYQALTDAVVDKEIIGNEWFVDKRNTRSKLRDSHLILI